MFNINKSIVEDFIESLKKDNKNILEEYFKTNSYYFAIILHERFSKAGIIMYIPNKKQFCYKLRERIYDITGEITDKDIVNSAVSWDRYKVIDDIDSDIIIKEKILILPEEEV